MLKLIHTTVANQKQADRLGQIVVERRLAACVQFVPIRSLYRWEGKIEQSEEVLLQIKTTADRASALEAVLAAEHPYEVPEIIRMDVEQVADAYAAWAKTETENGES